MITQVSQNSTQTREANEEQISRMWAMVTQTMVVKNITQETSGNQYIESALMAPETSSRRSRLGDRMAQVYWRVTFEVEPFLRGFFAPFTAAVRSCRLLSGKDKAELEAVMKKR